MSPFTQAFGLVTAMVLLGPGLPQIPHRPGSMLQDLEAMMGTYRPSGNANTQHCFKPFILVTLASGLAVE